MKMRRTVSAFEKDAAAMPAGRFFLRLYVAGATTRSRQAVRHVFQLFEAEQKDNYELEVIDVYQQPERARADQIVATPTLVKVRPVPMRRFIGNLFNMGDLFGEQPHRH